MKKIYAIIIVFITLITINVVNAEDIKTEELLYIDSIELIDKSETSIEKNTPTYEGLNLNVDVKFVNISDYIEYKIIIKNDSNKELELKLETIDNPSEYIKYTFQYETEEKVSPNSSTYVILNIKYENSVLEKRKLMLETLKNHPVLETIFYFNDFKNTICLKSEKDLFKKRQKFENTNNIEGVHLIDSVLYDIKCVKAIEMSASGGYDLYFANYLMNNLDADYENQPPQRKGV